MKLVIGERGCCLGYKTILSHISLNGFHAITVTLQLKVGVSMLHVESRVVY